MKKLILMRHGEAESAFSIKKDFERNLIDKGKSDNQANILVLVAMDIAPKLIVASSANRTTQTAEQLSESFDGLKTVFYKELYEAPLNNYLKILTKLDNTTDTVALVGHNPTISALARNLTEESVHFQTSNIAVIELSIEEWAHLSRGVGSLKSFI